MSTFFVDHTWQPIVRPALTQARYTEGLVRNTATLTAQTVLRGRGDNRRERDQEQVIPDPIIVDMTDTQSVSFEYPYQGSGLYVEWVTDGLTVAALEPVDEYGDTNPDLAHPKLNPPPVVEVVSTVPNMLTGVARVESPHPDHVGGRWRISWFGWEHFLEGQPTRDVQVDRSILVHGEQPVDIPGWFPANQTGFPRGEAWLRWLADPVYHVQITVPMWARSTDLATSIRDVDAGQIVFFEVERPSGIVDFVKVVVTGVSLFRDRDGPPMKRLHGFGVTGEEQGVLRFDVSRFDTAE